MKKVLALILSAMMLMHGPLRAQSGAEVTQARTATEHWLAVVDAGNYGDSWEKTAPALKNGMSKTTWSMLVGGLRLPLGKFKSRKLTSVTAAKPGSESVVAEYASVFENNPAVHETVTTVPDKQQGWKVTGYTIN